MRLLDPPGIAPKGLQVDMAARIAERDAAEALTKPVIDADTAVERVSVLPAERRVESAVTTEESVETTSPPQSEPTEPDGAETTDSATAEPENADSTDASAPGAESTAGEDAPKKKRRRGRRRGRRRKPGGGEASGGTKSGN